nr:putative signal peptide protein [blood disease bacterium R229]
MMNTLLPSVRRLLAGWVLGMLCAGLPANAADSAQELRDKYLGLAQQLADNPFHRPVVLDSTETPTLLKGDIYSVIDHPFATVNGTLNDPAQGPANWCDALILHLNIKYCRASAGEGGSALDVNLGRKVEQSLSSGYPLRFNYRSAAGSAGYFRVELKADSGPFSTRDYRIVLEAIPAAGNRTFLHLTYAYGYGTAGRLAMRTYLATVGADKVGFTNVAGPSAAQPEYVGGVRGLLERNTMRYYLAIDAYLKGLSAAPDKRLQQRLVTWFDATEQYARQLHEVDRQDYLQMKRHEYERQQAAQ